MHVTSVRELRVLQEVSHPNVVRLQEVAMGSGPEAVFLVFEFCQTDLARVIDGHKVPLALSETKRMMLQLLSALAFLEQRWIMHRDVKPSNILLDTNGVLKLCDFGLARRWSAQDRGDHTPSVTTLWYRAPEVLLGARDYTSQVDTWAAGCIMGELLLGQPLFPVNSELALLAAMAALLGAPNTKIWPGMQTLPGSRMTVPGGIQHSYNRLRQVRMRGSCW